MSPYIKSLDSTDIMSDTREKTPDQGITGEPVAPKRKTETAKDKKNWFHRILKKIMEELELIQDEINDTYVFCAVLLTFLLYFLTMERH